MTELTIKWLIGDNPKQPAPPASFQMLETSIRFMKHLLPDANRVIAVSQLVNGVGEVNEIGAKHECSVMLNISKHPELPRHLRKTHRRNAWYKYTPLKIGNGHTLTLDNDFIIWRIPLQMENWLKYGGLLGYGIPEGNPSPDPDGTVDWTKGIHFGSKHEWVESHAGSMALNSGLVGIGADVQELPFPLSDFRGWKEFVEDQAWWTVNYSQYEGEKQLIHYIDDMPVMYKWSPMARMKQKPDDFMGVYHGAHFTTHNNGVSTYFQDYCYQGFQKVLDELGV